MFTTLPDGSRLASLPLPSSMETKSSVSRCTVSFGDGSLKRKYDYTKFLTDSTVLEMNDAKYRVACEKNAAFLQQLSFDRDVLWGLGPALKDLMDKLPGDVTKLRLLGGEVLCGEMLEALSEAMEGEEGHTLYVQTSRTELLNDHAKGTLSGNLYLYCRVPNRSDELSMHSYPYAKLDEDAEYTDVDTYPDGENDVSYRLGKCNASSLRTGKAWWVSFNKKK